MCNSNLNSKLQSDIPFTHKNFNNYRRWSSDKATITPKPGISVLLESGKQSALTFTTSHNNSSGGYVTVEVVCSNNNDSDSSSKKRAISEAPDCVYVTEESTPADLAVLVPETAENPKSATEPEVIDAYFQERLFEWLW